ncbi:MAG: hypothetical protein KF788_18335 [Piscinibacter sp.]|nr:hypothetical protein [Piscinibacter sp.]
METTLPPGNAPIKTADGLDEIATRSRRLGQRHRTMLLLVDGRRSVAEVQRLAARAGVPASCYDELMEMGLIALPLPTLPISALEAMQAVPLTIDVPLPEDESVLPSSQSLAPESTLNGALGPAEPWSAVETGHGDLADLDPALEEARDMMLRAVRAEAPVAGSLTVMRLRRARTRADLAELIDEVEARVRKPHRMLAATLLMRRVQELIGVAADSSMTAA